MNFKITTKNEISFSVVRLFFKRKVFVLTFFYYNKGRKYSQTNIFSAFLKY